MPNPLTPEDPLWSRRRLVSAAVILSVLVLAAAISGGELALRLLLVAAAPFACLWIPYAVANFPLAGAMFSGRPASHTSSGESVVMIGWILLVAWVGYSLLMILT